MVNHDIMEIEARISPTELQVVSQASEQVCLGCHLEASCGNSDHMIYPAVKTGAHDFLLPVLFCWFVFFFPKLYLCYHRKDYISPNK